MVAYTKPQKKKKEGRPSTSSPIHLSLVEIAVLFEMLPPGSIFCVNSFHSELIVRRVLHYIISNQLPPMSAYLVEIGMLQK